MGASTPAEHLAVRMSGLLSRTPECVELSSITAAVVRLLAISGPVELEDVARTVRLPVSDVRRLLQDSWYTDWTADGKLAGFGLTIRPTPHRLHIAGRDLYVWTAVDALLAPVLLEQNVHIESSCHVTGTAISLDSSPRQVGPIDPETAVVSVLAHPEQLTRLRLLDHSRQLFFRNSQVAGPARTRGCGYTLLDVPQAFEFARRLAGSFFMA